MNKNSLLYFIAAVAATGGLLFGFDTGVINVALPQLRAKFNPSPETEGIIVSAVLFGGMAGPFISGPLTDLLGRKKINIIASICLCCWFNYYCNCTNGFVPHHRASIFRISNRNRCLNRASLFGRNRSNRQER
jgi:MFS family permease